MTSVMSHDDSMIGDDVVQWKQGAQEIDKLDLFWMVQPVNHQAKLKAISGAGQQVKTAFQDAFQRRKLQ